MADDEAAIGEVLARMYAMISGPAGPRDWAARAEVFHPDARQIRTGVDREGRPWMKIMGLDDYRADTEPFFAANPFYEVETARRVRVFGNIAEAWSVYEARRAPEAAQLDRRGVNAIQLFKGDDRRWRIVSMIWDNERPGLALPPLD
jgi:hypothetical protein